MTPGAAFLKRGAKVIRGLWRYVLFVSQFRTFSKMAASGVAPRFDFKWRNRYPCLNDNTATTGFDRHYLYHPAWAARVLASTKPRLHIDISSTLNFCSLVSAFVPTQFFDFRPANIHLSNLDCKAANLLRLPFANEEIHSISCMHVVEHIGLGRYGDSLDPDGDLKAMSELSRVLAVAGNLLFVVPVGAPTVMFNAHRVYSYQQIVKSFENLELVSFSLIREFPAIDGILTNASASDVAEESYGCGCFWFTKKERQNV